MKIFNNVTINDGDVSTGDYVKISGDLTTESINSYVDSLLTLFDCLGCDNLNTIAACNNNYMNFYLIFLRYSNLLLHESLH